MSHKASSIKAIRSAGFRVHWNQSYCVFERWLSNHNSIIITGSRVLSCLLLSSSRRDFSRVFYFLWTFYWIISFLGAKNPFCLIWNSFGSTSLLLACNSDRYYDGGQSWDFCVKLSWDHQTALQKWLCTCSTIEWCNDIAPRPRAEGMTLYKI